MTRSIRFSILTAFIAFLFIARVDAEYIQRQTLHGSNPSSLLKRASPSNSVQITSTTDYCMIVPSAPHTNIGDSENGSGGATTYCTSSADEAVGVIPPNFWTSVTLGRPPGNGDIIQLTGCIDPTSLDRLNPDDGGGQYDSSGGDDGHGNPAGSECIGYNHYVELIEPASKRACIRCCNDPSDCIITMDTSGCPVVIPGDYGNCGNWFHLSSWALGIWTLSSSPLDFWCRSKTLFIFSILHPRDAGFSATLGRVLQFRSQYY